jgi:hypothetical protein
MSSLTHTRLYSTRNPCGFTPPVRQPSTPTTPTKMLLDIWPPLPISIYSSPSDSAFDEKSVESLTVAVEHRDRISEIHISNINGPASERLIDVMHEPLPSLIHFYLGISGTDESVLVLPETFLGGSAPRLQTFVLWGIPFPSLPKFILSVNHIIHIHLLDIPHSGYISPDTRATCLQCHVA